MIKQTYLMHMDVREEHSLGTFWPLTVPIVADSEEKARETAIVRARVRHNLETRCIRNVTILKDQDISPLALIDIEQRIDQNDHGGALLVASKTLGCDDITDRLISINAARAKLGYLSFELSQDRGRLYNELMAFARANLSKAAFQKLRDAF